MATEFKFPDVGEGITEGTLVKWRVKLGEAIKADQVLCEVETDKAVVELPSPVAGNILRLNAREGEGIKVGQVLCSIGEIGENISKANAVTNNPVKEQIKANPVAETKTGSSTTGMILAAPHTRQLARDMGVDLNKVNGTGSGGRITDEDVKAAASPIRESQKTTSTVIMSGMEMPPAHIPTNLTNLPKSAPSIDGHVERVPIKGIRKAIYERMVRSAYTAPHATAMEDVDVTELVKVREKEKKLAEKKGIKLTFLPFICKALVEALKEHPYVNASVDDSTMELILKQYYNIGIATDTAEGLVVPVVKDVHLKSVLQIAGEIGELSEKAKNKNLKLDEVRGSTFTISNWGSLGGTYGVPIINYPDVAILGVGRMKETPVVIRNEKTGKPSVEIRWIMPISLSFDHRVVDGGEAVRFLMKLKEQLEDPYLFLVEVE